MKKDDCIFCKLSNGDIPTNALYEDDVVKVIFDLNPASKGHVLILPKNHFDDIYSMDDATAAHVFQVAVKVAKAMKETLGCEGLNVAYAHYSKIQGRYRKHWLDSGQSRR